MVDEWVKATTTTAIAGRNFYLPWFGNNQYNHTDAFSFVFKINSCLKIALLNICSFRRHTRFSKSICG